MKRNIIITPALLQEVEEKFKKSAFYEEKLKQAKANVKRSSESLKKYLPHLKFEE